MTIDGALVGEANLPAHPCRSAIVMSLPPGNHGMMPVARIMSEAMRRCRWWAKGHHRGSREESKKVLPQMNADEHRCIEGFPGTADLNRS